MLMSLDITLCISYVWTGIFWICMLILENDIVSVGSVLLNILASVHPSLTRYKFSSHILGN